MLQKFLPQTIAMLFLAGFVAYAWTGPAGPPPTLNADAPINVGTTTQIKAGALGIGGVLRAFSDAIIDGKVDVNGDIKIGGDIKIIKNGVECSVYSDCDNDGKTYFSGDCDESCSDCYVGSPVTFFSSPDGKDQDCNGKIDDLIVSAKKYPSPATGWFITGYAGTILELCSCFGGYNSGAWLTAEYFPGSTAISENYCGQIGSRYNIFGNIGSCAPGDDGGAPWCAQIAQCWNEYIR